MEPPDPPEFKWFLLIGLIGVVLRLGFVSAVWWQNGGDPDRLVTFNTDTKEYLHLADNLAKAGRYVEPDRVWSRARGLVRPPGYPLFCAAFLRAGGSPWGALFAQAVIGAAMPVMLIELAWILLRRRRLAILAGVLAAISGTGIAVTATALVDLLFAALFLAGFLAMAGAAAGARAWLCLLASLLFGLAALVKPTLLLWPLVTPVVWILLRRARGEGIGWGRLGALVAVQLVLMLGWCWRNYRVEGVFTLSSVSTRNLRFMLTPTIEEWARAGHYPDRRAVRANYQAAGRAFQRYVAGPGASAAGLMHREREESMAVLSAHPGKTLVLLFIDLGDQLASGWDMFGKQLPAGGAVRFIGRVLDGVWFFLPLACIWSILALGCVFIPAVEEAELEERDRRWRRGALWALFITFGYFLLLASTTHGQGSRILYPVEFARILLVLVAIERIARLVSRRAPRVLAENCR